LFLHVFKRYFAVGGEDGIYGIEKPLPKEDDASPVGQINVFGAMVMAENIIIRILGSGQPHRLFD